MDFLRNNHQKFLLGAGLASIAALGVWSFLKADPSKEDVQESYSEQNTLLNFKIKRVNGRIMNETLDHIITTIDEFAKTELTELILKNRKSRRSVSNQEEYAKLLKFFNEDIERIIEKARRKTFVFAGINVQEFNSSIKAAVKEGNTELQKKLDDLNKDLKSALPEPTKSIDQKLYEDVKKQWLSSLSFYESSRNFPENCNDFKAFANSKVEDIIFSTFGVEIEDIDDFEQIMSQAERDQVRKEFEQAQAKIPSGVKQ